MHQTIIIIESSYRYMVRHMFLKKHVVKMSQNLIKKNKKEKKIKISDVVASFSSDIKGPAVCLPEEKAVAA